MEYCKHLGTEQLQLSALWEGGDVQRVPSQPAAQDTKDLKK